MFLLADKQDITRLGLIYIIESNNGKWHYVDDKTSMLSRIREACLSTDAANEPLVVIFDYTLFDINDVAELQVMNMRFPDVRWIIFSEELSAEMMKMTMANCLQTSIVFKECSQQEIRESIQWAERGKRFICQRAAELLLTQPQQVEEKIPLTPTEQEILKDIALGLTTKEIAEKRFSSFHTVNTHRKNIFRKLGVNNVHEVVRYALRAGLVDSAEYYI